MVAQKVLEIAQDLEVAALVEGVETSEEPAWARDQGATYAQGYLISRPDNPPLKNLLTPRRKEGTATQPERHSKRVRSVREA